MGMCLLVYLGCLFDCFNAWFDWFVVYLFGLGFETVHLLFDWLCCFCLGGGVCTLYSLVFGCLQVVWDFVGLFLSLFGWIYWVCLLVELLCWLFLFIIACDYVVCCCFDCWVWLKRCVVLLVDCGWFRFGFVHCCLHLVIRGWVFALIDLGFDGGCFCLFFVWVCLIVMVIVVGLVFILFGGLWISCVICVWWVVCFDLWCCFGVIIVGL